MKEKVTVLFLTESVHPSGLERLCAGVAWLSSACLSTASSAAPALNKMLPGSHNVAQHSVDSVPTDPGAGLVLW